MPWTYFAALSSKDSQCLYHSSLTYVQTMLYGQFFCFLWFILSLSSHSISLFYYCTLTFTFSITSPLPLHVTILLLLFNCILQHCTFTFSISTHPHSLHSLFWSYFLTAFFRDLIRCHPTLSRQCTIHCTSLLSLSNPNKITIFRSIDKENVESKSRKLLFAKCTFYWALGYLSWHHIWRKLLSPESRWETKSG